MDNDIIQDLSELNWESNNTIPVPWSNTFFQQALVESGSSSGSSKVRSSTILNKESQRYYVKPSLIRRKPRVLFRDPSIIDPDNIADHAVTRPKIDDFALLPVLQPGAIGNQEVDIGAITDDQINGNIYSATGATSAMIQTGSITLEKIQDLPQIVIPDDYITTSMIVNSSLTSHCVSAGVGTTAGTDTVTADMIVNATIQGAKFADNTIPMNRIKSALGVSSFTINTFTTNPYIRNISGIGTFSINYTVEQFRIEVVGGHYYMWGRLGVNTISEIENVEEQFAIQLPVNIFGGGVWSLGNLGSFPCQVSVRGIDADSDGAGYTYISGVINTGELQIIMTARRPVDAGVSRILQLGMITNGAMFAWNAVI